MAADAVELACEEEKPAGDREEERLDAELVAGTEEATTTTIPDREGEVAEQVIDARIPPGVVGVEDQGLVAGAVELAVLGDLGLVRVGQLADELGPIVDAGVSSDPHLPIERERLTMVLGLRGCTEQGVAEADVFLYPDTRSVGSASAQLGGQRLDLRLIDGRAVEVHDADDSAHPRRPASSASLRTPLTARIAEGALRIPATLRRR